MKSFKLIRNINYNVINYILNIICIFNHQCYGSKVSIALFIAHVYRVLYGVVVRVLVYRSEHPGFKSYSVLNFFFQNYVVKNETLTLEHDLDFENHLS